MSVYSYSDLANHIGHKISCVGYGEVNVAIECKTCDTVLIDFDKHDNTPEQDVPMGVHSDLANHSLEQKDEKNELFCPYCGDQLTEQSELENAKIYYESYRKCPHWDNENKINEF